jgi:hypothetical protein
MAATQVQAAGLQSSSFAHAGPPAASAAGWCMREPGRACTPVRYAGQAAALRAQVLRQDRAPLLYSLVFGEGVINDATAVALLRAVQARRAAPRRRRGCGAPTSLARGRQRAAGALGARSPQELDAAVHRVSAETARIGWGWSALLAGSVTVRTTMHCFQPACRAGRPSARRARRSWAAAGRRCARP